MLISKISKLIDVEFKTLNMWCNRNDLVEKINGKSHIDPNDEKFVNYVKKKRPDFDFNKLKESTTVQEVESSDVKEVKEVSSQNWEYWKGVETKEKALIAELKRKELEKKLIDIDNVHAIVQYCDLIGSKMQRYVQENHVFFQEIGVQKFMDDINMFISESEKEINKML